MIYIILFAVGLVVGMVTTFLILVAMSSKYNKRRRELEIKATGLWQKAGELFESARIWYVIGNKEEAVDALDEAARIALEAKKAEDEADGKKTT